MSKEGVVDQNNNVFTVLYTLYYTYTNLGVGGFRRDHVWRTEAWSPGDGGRGLAGDRRRAEGQHAHGGCPRNATSDSKLSMEECF